jgi:uncharacterized protein (TIGR00661 family)
MRILYGVVGEGMGHATRSLVTLEHLLSVGHEVRVVVSGKAHALMATRFAGRSGIAFEEISGLEMRFEGTDLDKSATALANLEHLPGGVLRNVEIYRKVAEDGFHPQMVFSDFESWAYLYGINHRIPVVSIDNMQVLNRCRHDDDVTADASFGFKLTKLFVKLKLPWAYHYLVTSFFFPPVRKKRTTLLPPILRPEILLARREPGKHILLYQKASALDALLPLLQKLPHEFRLYGAGKAGREGNVTMCAFSEHGFVEDLRTARAVVAPGGFSLMGEAVHLHVPMLAVPLRGQYEQQLNARYLEKLGYGKCAAHLDEAALVGFLDRVDDYAVGVARYRPHDNAMLFASVDELIDRVARALDAPERLETQALGSFEARPDDTDDVDDDPVL